MGVIQEDRSGAPRPVVKDNGYGGKIVEAGTEVPVVESVIVDNVIVDDVEDVAEPQAPDDAYVTSSAGDEVSDDISGCHAPVPDVRKRTGRPKKSAKSNKSNKKK